MARKGSSLPAFLRAPAIRLSTCRLAGIGRGLVNLYRQTRDNSQLTCQYDALSGGQSVCNDNVVALALTKSNQPKLSSGVRLNDVDEGPVLADLSGPVGDKDRAFFCREN